MKSWSLHRLFAGVLLVTLLCAVGGARAAENRRPNVLFILTDDQGSVDVNCYGAHDLVTPNMDAIAASGVRFTQFEAAAPICSPSRAAILTGRVPQRAGLAAMASSTPGGHGMPGSQVTLAKLFKAAGYATGHVGKWHLGYVPAEEPNAQGFDYSFGHMGGCIDNYSHFFYWGGPDRHDLWRNGTEVWYDGQFFGDLMADEGRRFIRDHRSVPWLLYWAINEPHYPLQGTAKWRDRYKDLPSPRNMYAASLSTADERIGSTLATLDELGLRGDTIVCFMSDQGHSCEERTFGGGGSAGPYRGAKFSLFEGGIRVPAMIAWPGHVPAGQVRDQMCSGCDWLPTLAQLCDVPVPPAVADGLDGKSMVPVLTSPTTPSLHPTFFWASGRDQWAVRDGNWKLVGNPVDPTHRGPLPRSDAMFLSDLSTDVGERSNLAAAHPDVVARLTHMHAEWATQVGVTAQPERERD